MVNVQLKANSMASIIRLCFTFFLLIKVAFGAENRSFDYIKVTDPNIGLSKPIDTFNDTSVISWSAHCSSLSYCKSFVWDSSGRTCTTGSWPKANGDMITSGSKTYFTRISKCRFDLGFELRPYGTIEKCVYISTDLRNYQASEEECHRRGGRLFKSNTVNLINWIKAMAKEKGFVEDLWLGGDDRLSENNFIWSDGQRMTAQERAQLFSSGQPDNNQKRGKIGEDCLTVSFRQGNVLLNDGPCSIAAPYACEMDI